MQMAGKHSTMSRDLMDGIMGAVIEIFKCIGPQLYTYIQYHRKLHEIMEILRRKLEELNSRKEDIELRLSTELHLGKLSKAEVKIWLQNTERMNTEAQNIEQKFNKIKYFSRAQLGTLVEEKIREVKEHYQIGSSFESLVINAPSTGGVILSAPTLIGETTAKKNMDEIWKYLMGDEVMKIGICGMGGAGKTTIIAHINNKLVKETDKFKNVIWVTVSQPLDVIKLQEQIANALEQDISKVKEVKIRAAKILKMLEGRRFVVILDDMWEAFHLWEVGIPEPTEDNGCKLVITTRSMDVCRSMNCKVTVHVKPLPEDEALKLFLDQVGDNILQISTLGNIVKDVVEQCAGLPLAIVTVAGCMKGEYDIWEWRNALEGLSQNIKSVRGLETRIHGQLKFSYDRLKDEKVQRCLLYCALYPEDFKISNNELIQYWIAEGLVDEGSSVQATYDRGQSITNRLGNNCLLESAKNRGYVKMHDLIRDMALHITRKSPLFMIKAGENLRELPMEQEWKENLEKVSLMRNMIFEIPSDISPNCKALRVLLLQRNPLANIPECFFVNMLSLTILDLSYTRIKNLPNSVSNLMHLTALLLNRCRNLERVPSLAKLSSLQNLDLGYTKIKKLPEGMVMLTNLRYLDLYSFGPVVLPMGVLLSLCRLQKLKVYYGSNTSQVFTINEAVRLAKLDTLEGHFYNLNDFNLYVEALKGPCQQHKSYRLVMGPGRHFIPPPLILFRGKSYDDYYFPDVKDTNKFVTLYYNFEDIKLVVLPIDVQCLMLKDCYHLISLSKLNCLMLDKYSHLKALYVEHCGDLEKLFSPKLLRAFQNLEVIDVKSCLRIKEIIGYDDDDDDEDGKKSKKEERSKTTMFTLPKLRRLCLRRLPELNSICGDDEVKVCDSLQQIEVHECPKLKRLPLSLPLPALEEINVTREWWESLEWDNPNSKNVLQPFCNYNW